MLSSLASFTITPVTVGGSFLAVGVLVLLGMLVQKESAAARSGLERLRLFGQVLFIGAAPVLIVFIIVVIRTMAGMVY